ncbi:type VI secretion system Vgr family protein [Polyangium sorediatum]|uniref:Type VI secretion system tip protein TssI/VgrG n=1 Tax=Polyangium sorediatum TaxID=889274 RepID=A0ABT6P9I3_9BACT|nr:type VI secretion system tip protein TssI/VgrG [Polyangium sorediatum]MDI1437279.1 type VI secretion system tip protein TssI/VgrG [Polyangium sorediatum]
MSAQSNQEHASIEIAGRSFDVVLLEGQENISELFCFEVTCASRSEGPPAQALAGQAAVITLRDGIGAERQVKGLVAEASQRVHDDDSAQLRVVVRPSVYPLSLGRDSRVFQDSTVVDIVKKVLERSTAPTRWEVTEHYPTHVYCAQYREDDWTFISRLLEEEGIYYWFDHKGGETTLVFSDNSAAAPDLVGGAYIQFSYETGQTAGRELIEELGTVASAAPTKFTVHSFDPNRPLLAVGASVGAGPLEVYDAPGGGPESPAVCATRARLMQEAANTAKGGIVGVSTSVRLVPGMVVEIGGHPLARLDGRYLVTHARTKVVQREAAGSKGERPYVCHFEGIPGAVPYRPEVDTPLAKQAGLQTGIVVGASGQEVFPDAAGRVRVQFHWDREGQRDDAAGKWMRVAQRGTASSMLLPRVGWHVLTFNEEGTVDAPTVLSRIHDAEHPPSYPLPANKTRVVLKTATTPGGGSFNEIYFEDKKGQEEMFLNASRDMTVLVQNIKTDSVARDQKRVIGNNHRTQIASDQQLRVAHDQKVTVGGNEHIQVGGARSKVVDVNETSTVAGKRSIEVAEAHTTKVLQTRELQVGAALVDVSLGNIAANSQRRMSDTVGGAFLKMSAGSISEDVGKVGVYTVGGAKIEIAEAQRVIDIKNHAFETVGGALIMKTDDAFLDSADKKSKWNVGGAVLGDAPDVILEAKDKIELKCGGSVITLLPDSVEIRATSFDLSQAKKLVIITKKVEHNA